MHLNRRDVFGATTTSYSGNTTTVTDPAGKRKKFTYDAFGALTQVAEPDAGGNLTVFTNYTYDTAGRLTLVSMNGGAQTRSFTYNAYGQVLTATNPENGTATYTYNADGSLASKTDAKNQVMNFQYDAYHRVTRIYPPVGASYGYEKRFYYDAYDEPGLENTTGRLAGITWSGPAVRWGNGWRSYDYAQAFSYTNYGAVTRSKLTLTSDDQSGNPADVRSLEADFSWTMQGEPSSITYPSGRQIYYKFDSAGRVNGLSANANWQWSTYYSSCPNGTADLVAGASYNKAGQLTATDFGGGVTETRTYNNLLQLTRIQAGLMDLSYLYPDGANNGRISAEVNNLTNTTVSYGYDQMNRLSTAVSATGGTTNWGLGFGYDVYGNRTAQTVTAGTAPAFQAQFDNNNRMTVPATSYDANGNQLTTPDGAALQYDWDNRMSNWTRGADTERYDYHPAGWRVLKQPTAGYYSSTLYLYGPSGQLLSDSSGKDYAYFAGRLAYTMEPGWAGGCSARTRVYGDRLGTVRASEPLLGTSTTRSFYPFGEEIGTPSANDQYKFASTYRDSSSGLDYAVNRYYASGMGRFLTVDPKGGKVRSPQSFNLYAYAYNDPVNGIDPKGLSVRSVIGGIIGAILGDDEEESQEADDWSGFIANGASPGSYGTGGPGGTAPTPPSALATGVNDATARLGKKPCSDLFSGIGDAAALLNTQYQAGRINTYSFTGGLRNNPAMTMSSGTNVSININTNPAINGAGPGDYGFFGAGDYRVYDFNGNLHTLSGDDKRAFMLIHELGHFAAIMFGASRSAIIGDSNPDGTPNSANERQNNTLIWESCFK